jgi:hypothetical protein
MVVIARNAAPENLKETVNEQYKQYHFTSGNNDCKNGI